MNKVCYIVCNGPVPELGTIIIGPGLRARQLYIQANLIYENVKYLFFDKSYDLVVKNEGIFEETSPVKNCIFIRSEDQDIFLEKQVDNIFVFTQVMHAELALKLSTHNTIIYDFLACKERELKCGNKSHQAKKVSKEINNMIQISKRIFFNGAKKKDLLMNKGASGDALFENAFVPITSNAINQKNKTFDLLWGGNTHPWINSHEALDTFIEFAKLNPDKKLGAFIPSNKDENYIKHYSTINLLPNITVFGNMNYVSYCEVLLSSRVFIDWNQLNDERKFSTSIRTLQAISLGMVPIHNANTDISWFDNFPGILLDRSPECEDINMALEYSYSDMFIDANSQAIKINKNILNNKNLFSEIL